MKKKIIRLGSYAFIIIGSMILQSCAEEDTILQSTDLTEKVEIKNSVSEVKEESTTLTLEQKKELIENLTNKYSEFGVEIEIVDYDSITVQKVADMDKMLEKCLIGKE